MIGLTVEVHALSNQAVKIHFERLGSLVPSKRGKCSSTQHILRVSQYTRPAGDAREVLEDPSLKSLEPTNHK